MEPFDVENAVQNGVAAYPDSSPAFSSLLLRILFVVACIATIGVIVGVIVRVVTHDQVIASDDGVFVVVGDWGYHGLNNEREVANAMARWCVDNGCQCVLSTGDNFYPDGVRSVDDDHFLTSFEQVFNGTGISRVPFLVSVGNHDYQGNVSAEIDYGQLNPRWHFPSRYYTRTLAFRKFNLRLVAVDTTPLVSSYADAPAINHADYDAQDPQAQLIWLTQVLANTSADTINIVFGHHPVVSPAGLQNEEPEGLRTIFETYKVPLVISGHAHNLQHSWYEGKNVPQYVISGGGGLLAHPNDVSPTNCQNCSSWLDVQNGFLGVRVNQQRINLQFWSMSSVLLREANIWLD